MLDAFGRQIQLTPQQQQQQNLDSAWLQYVQKLTLSGDGPNTGPEDYRRMLRDQDAKKAFILKFNQEQASKDLNNLTPEQQARLNEVTLRNQELASELERSKSPQAQEQIKLDRARTERNKDLAEGRARGEELFAEGSMGRYSADVLDRLKKGAEGFTPEEMNAMREQNLSTVNQGNQAASRALKIQQALSGIRGSQATAQAAKLKAEQGGVNAANERELFLKNIDARRSGLASLQEAERYGNEQGNREKSARLTTELGYGSLGSADRGAVMQSIIGAQQAAAAAKSGGGGGKK